MSRTHTPVLLCVLTVCITSLVLGTDEAQSDDECADLNNYTFLEYRQQRGKVQVQYLLLTRRNMDCAERFRHESLSETQHPPTNFNISRPTKVIIHGFRITGSRPTWVRLLARTLLEAQDVNVLVVDWVYCASFAYNQVVENYKEAALQISVLINQLQEHGCKLQSFHFIGISLGAHVAGFVGTLFEGKIGRITGLDVAGPLFKGADTYDRLDPSDALFVEAIHTDSDYFGISISVGHVDFFLNGGKDQTGCARSKFSSVFGYVLCDHMRAIYVYMSALNGSCPLVGVPCFSYEDFLQGRCLTCDAFNGKCPTIGLSENSGISISPLPKEQKLFLLTTSSSPFCTHQILLQVEVSPLDKSAEVEMTLVTENQGTEQKLPLRKDTTVYSVVLSHPFALCEINSMKIKNTGNRFYRQGDIHVKSVCLSEIPSQSREEPLCVNNIDIRRGAPWSHDFVQVCGSS
ncbi:phospholipase A1 member A isoform X2 [Pseudochaenichthys georgianus]|uniref:phospholipase A1 member A isoform X2 n=1 Tax=Pseudochaenichthys georgianus TaxID=52239 RepID=UPI00146BB31A|nr:phospholipase A1 member A isoform X2 [Pseudochaenichthys georgianus]